MVFYSDFIVLYLRIMCLNAGLSNLCICIGYILLILEAPYQREGMWKMLGSADDWREKAFLIAAVSSAPKTVPNM